MHKIVSHTHTHTHHSYDHSREIRWIWGILPIGHTTKRPWPSDGGRGEVYSTTQNWSRETSSACHSKLLASVTSLMISTLNIIPIFFSHSSLLPSFLSLSSPLFACSPPPSPIPLLSEPVWWDHSSSGEANSSFPWQLQSRNTRSKLCRVSLLVYIPQSDHTHNERGES